MLHLVIDGINIEAKEGSTILEAATANGIEIPTLCYDKRVELYGACGLCVVEAEGVPKLLRACATKATEGMVINTKTPRVIRSRKVALELLLSDHDGDCKAPCSLACPAGTDCQGYVGMIANGEYKEAIKLIKDKIPMPASIGRVCPHPCEKACRRQNVEEPISIAWLKSFAADMDLKSDDVFKPEVAEATGKKVAVIGGGPGGLTTAYYLKIMGHDVTVYDAMPNMGGMLRYGIPQYRLPKEVVEREVQEIASIGVKLQNNVRIGKDITLEELRNSNDAVVVAIGAWKSSSMRAKGEDLDGVLGGIDFLRNSVMGLPLNMGKKVAVVGGGNTAMDACRTAVRQGAEEIYVIYRRTRSEMPADDVEIEEAIEEGIEFKFLTNPDEIIGENGKVKAVRLQKMELGEPDASGRRSPVAIEGAFEEIELDTVIMAIGQYANLDGFENLELTRKRTIAADESTFRTSLEGVFAVGDATNKGADIAISAIGEGKKAAEVIDTYLNGEIVGYKKPYVVERVVSPEEYEKYERANRPQMPHLSPEERKHNFEEIVKGYSVEDAKKEASRCLECGCHDFYECKLIKYANEYDVKPARFGDNKHQRRNEQTHPYIERNPDKCILCGLCVRVCEEVMGITALGLIGRGFDTIVQPEFDKPLQSTECISCGQCVTLCPTGALREIQPVTKPVPAVEKETVTTCSFCSAGCQMKLKSVGNTILRAVPEGECSLLCADGRFGFGERQSVERKLNAKVNGETVSFDEAAKAINEAFEKYDASDIGVAISESLTNEEATAAKEYAEKVLKTSNIFTYSTRKQGPRAKMGLGFSPKKHNEKFGEVALSNNANAKGLENLGIKKGEDTFKAMFLVGEELPEGKKAEFVAKIGLFNDDANVFVPQSTFAETNGTVISADGETLTVRKAVDPVCETDTLTFIKKLMK